jgi:hypothetical protein
MDNFQRLDADVATQILLQLPLEEVTQLRKVSHGLQSLVLHLDTVPNYWKDLIRGRAIAYCCDIPGLREFWLDLLNTDLLSYQWRQLYFKPDYSVGNLLPEDQVYQYTTLVGLTMFGHPQRNILKGIVSSDRLSLFQKWVNKYSKIKRSAYNYALTGNSWNIFVYSATQRLREAGTNPILIKQILRLAAKSSDIAHYMYIARVSGIDYMFSSLTRDLIVYMPDRLSYYLQEVPQSQEVFNYELAILRQSFWTYHRFSYRTPPGAAYLRFLSTVVDYSKPTELRQMIETSPITGSGDTLYNILRMFCKHPKITRDFLTTVLVPKIASNPPPFEVTKTIINMIGIDIEVYIAAGIIRNIPEDIKLVSWILNTKDVDDNTWDCWMTILENVYSKTPIHRPRTSLEYTSEKTDVISRSLLIKLNEPTYELLHDYLSRRLLGTPRRFGYGR